MSETRFPLDAVRPGTLWRDDDPREQGRRVVKVLRVEGQYAYVVGQHGGRHSRVLVDRLRRYFTELRFSSPSGGGE